MSNFPSSCASCRVRPTTACFALQYACMPVSDGCSPAPELILMIRPPPCPFHARHRSSAQRERGVDVDIKYHIPVRVRHVLQRHRPLARNAAGVVDQDIDRAPGLAFRSRQPKPAAAPRSRRSSACTVIPPVDAVSAKPSAPRSVAKTEAPSRANVLAISRPNPWPAPVTATTLPSNRMIMGRLTSGMLLTRTGRRMPNRHPAPRFVAFSGRMAGLPARPAWPTSNPRH